MQIAKRRMEMLTALQASRDAGNMTQSEYDEALIVVMGGDQSQQPVNVVVDQPNLTAVMEKQLRYQEFPWAQYQDSHASTYRSLEADAHKPGMQAILREEVEQRAKENDLSPMEVMALQYLLFYSEVDDPARNLLAIFILRTPLQTRFATHNWGAVAPAMLEADVKEHGLAMTQIQYPLFPGPRCRLLNEKVFRAHYTYMAEVSGGGVARESEVPAFFRGEKREPLRGGDKGRGEEVTELRRKVADLERKLANTRKERKATPTVMPNLQPAQFRSTWKPMEGADGSIDPPKSKN